MGPAGWLGHYVGDAAQPLHWSYRYHGWLGENPEGYTTERHIHSQFEGAFIQADIRATDVEPFIFAKPTPVNDVFIDYMAYLKQSHTMYEQVNKYESRRAQHRRHAGVTAVCSEVSRSRSN